MRLELTEHLTDGPAHGLAGLLGVPLPAPEEGLPLLWHWLHLLDRPATADLGPDGHALRGVLPAPPRPGLRRMWAGGRVVHRAPLLLGCEATRVSTVESVQDKAGSTGPLVFVTVRHEVRQDGRLAVEELQRLVYREPGPPLARPAPGPAVPLADDERAWEVTPPLLARFSALTYNGHRIHYDRDYARDVEGYPGLVVHGPLQALLMAEVARAAGLTGRLPVALEYRLLAPLLDDQGLVAGGGADGLHVRDRAGRRTAQGTVTAT